jgi:nucleoside-diphosphate-sugar epimerase
LVGSHILDILCARGVPTAVLLRPTADKGFIAAHLETVQIRTGSITEPATLRPALEGITHVIHSAGCTKARRASEFFQINAEGTRNIVEAVNGQKVNRLVHISSLAATGPATADRPAREDDPTHPVSTYGKSKLAGETEVRTRCGIPFTILRPAAVYGPRDRAFLPLFRAIRSHVLPRPSATQQLSLIYAADLAKAVVEALTHPAAAGDCYFVAGPEVASARRIADIVGALMKRWTVSLPLPTPLMWPVCVIEELCGWITGRARLLNLQKFAEIRAGGWVCDSSRIQEKLGWRSRTRLEGGLAETLTWYQANGWL